jgi:hypothetical protein
MLVPIHTRKLYSWHSLLWEPYMPHLCINFVNLDVQISPNAQFCAKNLTTESKTNLQEWNPHLVTFTLWNFPCLRPNYFNAEFSQFEGKLQWQHISYTVYGRVTILCTEIWRVTTLKFPLKCINTFEVIDDFLVGLSKNWSYCSYI